MNLPAFAKFVIVSMLATAAQQTVGEEEPKAAGTLPPENNNLMSQGDELKLQRCATADAEREQGNQSGQNRDHAPRG